MFRHPRTRIPGWILVVIMIVSLTYTVSAADTGSVTVIVSDALTKKPLAGAQVYLDGGYRGTTVVSGSGGVLIIPGVSEGKHTLRITKDDYKQVTKKFTTPAGTTIAIELSKGALVSLNPNGPSSEGIDVVFYPSSTSYSCTNNAIVSTPVYLENESRFKEDVTKIISQTYLSLDKDTSPSMPLPSNYQSAFNFYYYYDPSAPADAFSGCTGTVPENYYSEVPFNDLTVILYPSYFGTYKGSPCQPTGCYQDFGPGRSLMKAPADRIALFKHETGHAAFGLVDTYCGDTYYYQNDPNPNVWSSLEKCKSDARDSNRDPEQCRQIQKTGSPGTCQKNYWQWDPMPDIMANGYGGSFGSAATQRITWVLSQAGAD